MSLAAFASLIEDSFAVRQTADSSSCVATANANRSNSGASQTDASKSNGVAQSASHKAAVAAAVAALEEKLSREKSALAAAQSRKRRAEEVQSRSDANRRRWPRWLVESMPSTIQADGAVSSRAWEEEEQAQLRAMLRESDDGVCRCSKRANGRTSSRSPAPGATACCFARLAHVAQVLHRPLSDIETQMQTWSSAAAAAADPFARDLSANVATPAPVPAAPAPLDETSIASRWAAADPVDFLPYATRFVPEGVMPMWSATRVHQLVTRVREDIEQRAEQRRSKGAEGHADEDATQPNGDAHNSDHSSVAADIRLRRNDWERIALSLSPPSTGDAASAVYFSVLGQRGFVVPRESRTLDPFYFPDQARYEGQLHLSDSMPFDDEGDGEAEAHSDARDISAGEESDGEDKPMTGMNRDEVLQVVRRLSKRYRR